MACVVRLAAQLDPTRLHFVVRDNAPLRHTVPLGKREHGLPPHLMALLLLPPRSPELNFIEIAWKHAEYHWRRFTSWSADRLQFRVHTLLDGPGSKHKTCFA